MVAFGRNGIDDMDDVRPASAIRNNLNGAFKVSGADRFQLLQALRELGARQAARGVPFAPSHRFALTLGNVAVRRFECEPDRRNEADRQQ